MYKEAGIALLPRILLRMAFLVSGRWSSFHLRMSSQQFAADPLSDEDTELDNSHKMQQNNRILEGEAMQCVVRHLKLIG